MEYPLAQFATQEVVPATNIVAAMEFVICTRFSFINVEMHSTQGTIELLKKTMPINPKPHPKRHKGREYFEWNVAWSLGIA